MRDRSRERTWPKTAVLTGGGAAVAVIPDGDEVGSGGGVWAVSSGERR